MDTEFPRQCVVTALYSTDSRHYATKIFSPAGAQSYSRAFEFRHREVTIPIDLQERAATLRELAANPHEFAVSGRVKPDRGEIVNRRKLGDDADMIEVPTRWVMVDIDSLPYPEDVHGNLPEVVRFACGELAKAEPAFAGVGCVAMASASYGRPGKEQTVKLHLVYVSDTARPPEELRALFKAANARYQTQTGCTFKLSDTALYNGVQPHYLAAPLFVGGEVDPIPDRIFVLEGSPTVKLPERVEEFPAPGAHHTSVARQQGHASVRRAVRTAGEITGNVSRNAYFLGVIGDEIRKRGPFVDEAALVQRLRAAVMESSASPEDRIRWMGEDYLQREVQSCLAFHRQASYADHFGLSTAGHDVEEIWERWLPPLPAGAGVLLVKSGMGSGKTHQLRALVQTHDRAIVLTHRVALARELAQRLGVACYLDVEGPITADKVVVCINSLHRVALPSYNLVAIDEVDQFIRHAAHLPARHKPNIATAKLQTLIQGARQVVCLDGQLSDLTRQTLESIRPGERFHIILNQHTAAKSLRVHGTKAALLAAFDEAVSARLDGGKPAALVSNSKAMLRGQYERLRQDHPELRLALVTAETAGNPEIQRLLSDFDGVGQDYDAFLCSPAVATGISIDVIAPALFGIFEAQITAHTDCAQALSRFRRAETADVWLALGSVADSIDAAAVLRAKKQFFDSRDIPMGCGGLREQITAAVYDFERHGRGPLRQNFLYLAEESGWHVEFIGATREADTAGREMLRDGKALGEAARVAAILEAPDLTESEAAAIERQHLPDEGAAWALERYKIREALGLRTLGESDVRWERAGAGRRALRNLELAATPAEKLQEADCEDKAMCGHYLDFAARERKAELLKLILRAVGLPSHTMTLGAECTWNAASLNAEVVRTLWNRRVEIKAALGIALGRNFLDAPLRAINQVLADELGLTITSTRPRKGGARARTYRLDEANLQRLKSYWIKRLSAAAGVVHSPFSLSSKEGVDQMGKTAAGSLDHPAPTPLRKPRLAA